MEEKNDATIAMEFIVKFNEFQHEIIKSMNYIREDIHELKDSVNDLRQELRDYKEENNRRWEENDKRWEENKKQWEKYEENRKSDRKFLLDTLTTYDLLISEQLGDPNVDKMRKFV